MTRWWITVITLAMAAAAVPAIAQTSQPANLLLNGGFEQAGDDSHLPAHWTSRRPECIERINLGEDRGHAIRMTGDEALMATYGVDLVSEPIPIKPNTRYRCTGQTRGDGPAMIVFVKGYATVTRRVDGEMKTFDDVVYQMRKEMPSSTDWRPFNLDFEIRPATTFSDFQHRVKYVRLTLWSYWPAGTCWYDDVRFEEVGPIPQALHLHGEAMTHTGEKPSLATDPEAPPEMDEQRMWFDAANAFLADEFERATRLAVGLLERTPNNADYRVLAARSSAAMRQWDDAGEHAQWLLAHDRAAPWQREWAQIVLAQVKMHHGDRPGARWLLEQMVETAQSEHARAAAREILGQLAE